MLPRGAVSLDEAHAAIELWEFYKKRTLDPTQRLVVEVMMATGAGDLWAAATTGREMPRQNGKGDEVEVVELWGLVQRSERILHTVHDAVLLATETQSRLLDGVIEAHADLRRLKLRAWRGTGQQMIEMRNGGIIWYRTRTGGGARGVDEVDRVVVDEAQHAELEHLAAITSTQLASANPQLNAIGTAAIEGKSSWWWSQRKMALRGEDAAFGYVGHTAENVTVASDGRVMQLPVDSRDRSLWPQVNPALASGRTSMSYFERELSLLGDRLFAREHLGVWDAEPAEMGAGAIDLSAWAGQARGENHAEGQSSIASHRSWGLAVTPDRKWASLGVAGRRTDGLLHVEWMEHRAGTGWILDRVVEGWLARRIPIRIHANGAEGSFIAPLREAGVEVVEISASELARDTGMFIDGVNEKTLVHIDQASLTRAVTIAGLRTSTAGGSVWDDSSGDITPLKAVTVALGGVPQTSDELEPFFAAT